MPRRRFITFCFLLRTLNKSAIMKSWKWCRPQVYNHWLFCAQLLLATNPVPFWTGLWCEWYCLHSSIHLWPVYIVILLSPFLFWYIIITCIIIVPLFHFFLCCGVLCQESDRRIVCVYVDPTKNWFMKAQSVFWDNMSSLFGFYGSSWLSWPSTLFLYRNHLCV